MRTDVKISGIGVLWAAVGAILLIWLWKPAPPLADEIYLGGIIAFNLVAFGIGVHDQRARQGFDERAGARGTAACSGGTHPPGTCRSTDR